MENNLKGKEQAKETLTIKDIFLSLKRHIVLMLAVILAFTVVGVVYTFVLKPRYTVTQKLIYTCENLPYVNGKGETVNANTTTANINTMLAYGDTIIDLFDEGVVLDRANYYYKEYLNEKRNGEESAKTYLTELANKASSEQKDSDYTPPTDQASREQLNFINGGQISTSKLSKENETKFAFNVSYTDSTREEAQVKLNILVCSFALECKETKNVILGSEEKEVVKYFGEFKVIVSDLGVDGVSNNLSRVKTIALFMLGGIIASLVAVWVVNLFDSTIKSKEELEKITGAATLTAIEKVEG